MVDEIKNVKGAILTWTYNVLNTAFPDNFKLLTGTKTSVINGKSATKTFEYPNVYWADTRRDRPSDAVECTLRVVGDSTANSKGSDGEFYLGEDEQTYYTKLEDTHIITVKFAVNTMKKNDSDGSTELSDLQADNLVHQACSHLRMLLKSEQSSSYFLYDNEIFTPIFVLSQGSDISDIDSLFEYEETRGRHTSQFTCKFAFDITETITTPLAQGVHIILDEENDLELDTLDIEFVEGD